MTELELLEPAAGIEAAEAVAEVSRARSLEHRELRRGEFWRGVPGFVAVPASEFHTHTFQSRNTVTNVRQLQEALQDRMPDSFYQDVIAGLKRAPMALRISPYLLSLVDWSEPYRDPIRTQFLPCAFAW